MKVEITVLVQGEGTALEEPPEGAFVGKFRIRTNEYDKQSGPLCVYASSKQEAAGFVILAAKAAWESLEKGEKPKTIIEITPIDDKEVDRRVKIMLKGSRCDGG